MSTALSHKTWGSWERWGDDGDGQYHNPVLPADYSDIDVIRVGLDYYAISSTFQYSPGMIVLHSRDLVNWRIAGHVIDDITQIGPEYGWSQMNRYGRGVWAGSIRYHNDRFWVYFGTPDEGFFVTTAEDANGPWEPLRCVLQQAGWDDCCPFWDDDGRGYLVGTDFAHGYKTWLFEMTPDGCSLADTVLLLNQGQGREASKLYKVGTTYYHMYSEHIPGQGRRLMMQRAESIKGPYSETRQLSHPQREANEPNQGGLVQTPSGSWVFLTHHGTGDWEGRCVSLLPVTWMDGWPIIGQPDANGVGSMVWSGEKMGSIDDEPRELQRSDDFRGPTLGPQWEWNHQPRSSHWSLAGGALRLYAFQPLQQGNFKTVGNVLTQRVLRTKHNTVTLHLRLDGLAEGQVAGLCHLSGSHGSIGVRLCKGGVYLEATHNSEVTPGLYLHTKRIWLRSTWGLSGVSRFSYSTGEMGFTDFPFEASYQLRWGDYRGARIGIFTFNSDGDAGHVDCESFTYDITDAAGESISHAIPDVNPDLAKTPATSQAELFGNPLIPDLLADPSIVQFDGTFYCYATTDGWGRRLASSGPPVVWTSKDFRHWEFHGSCFPADFDLKYWAPSAVIHRHGLYYMFPTLDEQIAAAVADSPLGPFKSPDGQNITRQSFKPYPLDQAHSIDAEVFVDDDAESTPYMVWSRRRIAKLADDLLTLDSPATTIPTKRDGYSEGPWLTKRKGVYYYFYTIGGAELYQYAYMTSTTSPFGPWHAPENDIIARTDVASGVMGPGHGCVFNLHGTDDWYFVFLEFGRASTNRCVFASRLYFELDGSIRPIQLTKDGVGPLRATESSYPGHEIHLDSCTVTASSRRDDALVRGQGDPTFTREDKSHEALAVDGLNGTRWLAAPSDPSPWIAVDLGRLYDVQLLEVFFVRPTAGHGFRLEVSSDGSEWLQIGNVGNFRVCSPHRAEQVGNARFIRIAILQGEPGIWKIRAFA